MKCDFEGYVTKNDIRCMDGRIIRKDAFKENDKMSVPLVWQHRHDSPENVLGHMELENREDGVYGYGFFNNTDMANTARELVANKDIRNMSIYANHLIEKDKNVTHGSIKEVSLVLAGANPGAVINHVSIAHSDGFVTEIDDECDIFTDEEILYHADEDEEIEEGIAHSNKKEDDKKMPDKKEHKFGKAYSEMTKEKYESILADMDEIDRMLDDLDQMIDGKTINHSAFEEDDELALVHYASPYYDPVYAHEYYMLHRQLKGRKKTREAINDYRKHLMKNEREEVKKEKRQIYGERDIDVGERREEAENDLSEIKKETKTQRADLKQQTFDDISWYSEQKKDYIKSMQNQLKKDLKNAYSKSDAARIKAEYKREAQKIRAEHNEARENLLSAYKKDSRALTLASNVASKDVKNEFDEDKLERSLEADQDFYDFLESYMAQAISEGADRKMRKDVKRGKIREDIFQSDEDSNYISHESSDETVADILATLDEKQKKVAAYIIGTAIAQANDSELAQDDFEFDDEETIIKHEDGSEETVGDIFETFNEKQKNCVYYLVSQALENNNIEHSDEGGTEIMKRNIFENDQAETNVLTHADFSEIVAEAKKSGSLKDAFLAHAGADYGFGPYTPDRDSSYDGKYGPTEGIDVLFPDARLVDKKIEMLRNNPTDWVVKVMNGVHKSPFSRIKMIYADITADAARAKGYVTGAQKVSEVIALLHRTTAPTTIYKLQKLDRDDIIDITDFDIVAWLKAEMRIMLEEEIARQILVGDFRSTSDNDRIDPNCVRPILTDTSNDLYAMRYSYAVSQTENEYEKFIDECCLAMIDYEGTGSPTLYTTPEYVGHMLLVKDTLGNRIYKTKAELASACGVKEIVECPYMKDQTRLEDSETIHSMGFTDASDNDCLCKGIIVNLTDYTVGADKGGAVNMFDDFDIDFNKYTYLIETRISGSLTKPKSAIVIGVQQA